MPLQNRSKVPIGTVLEDKYRITGELGRGGMATVYEAENIDIGKRVAVKVLAAELVTSRIVRERFIREARAAAAIRSPYICDVYDSGMFEERPFLVMELLEGESLYDRMTRVRRIDVHTTVRVITLTARGLGKAHEAGVVHRDMKPENIFLLKSEEGELTVKIVDFGLAKFYEPTGGDPSRVRLTRQGALFGTPAYMSPEQAKGQGEVDHRADLWALGCITYECLTGRTVWKVDQGVAMILAQIAGAPLPRPSAYRKDLPEAFDRWFFKALDRDITRRFQTAKELTDALDEALGPVSELLAETPTARARPPPSVEPRHASDTDPTGRSDRDAFESYPLPSVGSSAMDEAEDRTPSATLPGPTPPPSPRSGQAIATLVATAIVVLTGYALWLYVLYPPQPRPVGGVESGTTDAPPDPSARPQLRPVEREPYALQIGAGQEWLIRGRLDNAVKMFKEAFTNGGSGVARALLYHAALAQEATPGPCRVTGLGRPRPFEVTTGSSPPTLAVTQAGPVAAWVDNHQDKAKWQAYTTLLDSALRRVGPALVVTPEVGHVRSPEFVPAGEKLALVYCVRGSPEGGVYVRLLEQDGRIAGKAQQLASLMGNFTEI
jgi:serine/threonine protein kinase